MARMIILIGIILVVIGLVWMLAERLGLGRLPGDIVIEREGFRLYIPLMTMLIISIVLSRGKRRLHQKPNAYEIDRCKWWLDLELEIIKPELTVALGGTALRALAGRPITIKSVRGEVLRTADGRNMLVTIHPSLILRLRESKSRAAELARFTDDLRKVGRLVPAVRM